MRWFSEYGRVVERSENHCLVEQSEHQAPQARTPRGRRRTAEKQSSKARRAPLSSTPLEVVVRGPSITRASARTGAAGHEPSSANMGRVRVPSGALHQRDQRRGRTWRRLERACRGFDERAVSDGSPYFRGGLV